MAAPATGGCLCGRLRYAVDLSAGVADWCHCAACRRWTGSVAVAWMQVTPDAFRITAGTPATYASSPTGRRHHCPSCGSPVFMTDTEGRSVGILAGSLDDPDGIRPVAHGFCAEAVGWVRIDDALPRHDGPPPHDEA